MSRELIRFDWAMKRMLRDKANYRVLEGFLAELLKFDLKIVHIGDGESNQQTESEKFNRVDILAHTLEDEIILIELQIDTEIDYFHRMLFGVSRAISEHIKKGEAYEKVKKVFSINIVYFHLGQGEDYVYHGTTEFRGLHKNDLLNLNHRQKDRYTLNAIHEIFPEYYILKINEFNDVAKDGLDEWIYFLKNNEIKDNFKAKGLDAARESLAYDKMSTIEKNNYRRAMDNAMYAASMFETAKYEGHSEGKAEGKAEGIVEGRKKGRKEGIEQTKLEIARKLLDRGFSLSDIISTTGCSEEEIKSLKK